MWTFTVVLCIFLLVTRTTFGAIPLSVNSIDATLSNSLSTYIYDQGEEKEIRTIGRQGRCLKDVKEASPKKFFQLENDIFNITLESSNRVGHQMLTHAFSIFLQEVLGYDSVTVRTYQDNYDASVVLHRLSGLSGEASPETMVNLAVLLPHDVELTGWTSPEHLEICGHLGFAGRFGWFMPINPVVREHSSVDYWRTFHNNPKIASYFSLEGDALEFAKNYSQDATGKYYCEMDFCEGGMYTPQKCAGVSSLSGKQRHGKNHHACAILLASYPELEIQSALFLRNQLDYLDLNVKIMYVGPNLEFVVHELARKFSNSTTQGVLFFTWKPSLVTTELDLISVSFPACNSDLYCNYESRKLEKIVWSKFKEGAKAAYETVHRISFSPEEYVSMLNVYKKVRSEEPHLPMDEVACRWMNDKSGRAVWDQWKIPGIENEKTPLYIGGIFPLSGTFSAPGILIAAKLAAAAVNANNTVLKDYSLKMFAYDGQCRADMVMKSFIDYIRLPQFRHIAGILGPACSDTVEPLAGVARHYKTVVISYSAEGSSFSDRTKYPYFFRTIGENKNYQYVYLELFRTLKWARVASLTEEGQKYAEYVSHLHDLLQANGIAFIANRKFPRDKDAYNKFAPYLQDLKAKKAKIIIGDFYDSAARAVMCEAYKQKMTAKEGYVWFLPTWFIPRWYDTDSYNNISSGKTGTENVPCNTSEMIQAINGHLSLSYAYYAEDDHIMQENITVSDWRQKYEKSCSVENKTISDYGGYAYDAVWTYAYALEKLLKQDHSHIANLHSENTTNTFVQILNETNFSGVSGQIKFLGGPSRSSNIHVVQWFNNRKLIVGTYYPVLSNGSNEIIGGTLDLNESAIVWLTPTQQRPGDGTELPQKCFLETLATALDVTCEVAIVIANVIGFGILGLVLVMCFVIIKRRYDRRVQITEDYFKALGIDLLSATSVSTWDKWEMPRDRVVINRKLGEGAFGTVYGGEAFYDDKGGWVAVAVKTLKVGSTCEQKLDFLSEAEVMKRFEHKNIIKLLGVCTKSEPVYTIMEFMLYGDLKTYLLARRHLVNERNCEESDEISSKRLTSMALDVARALSYLAELKYVHRDLAARNCLVNVSRVVKLGDFGMTRPMYENDYYRFNRKGMLPVRWMSPESLALGIFTPASDVWSFGVLLYEIITFGSFPFQGLSNNQVLEQVKAGATISIPPGVKTQLDCLLKSCWAMEVQRRPAASEIVEFLANNPRIISPCLDIPLASVQLEGTDQLEIQIPERLRKVTSKSINKNRAVRENMTINTNVNGDVQNPEIIPLNSPNGLNHHHNHNHNNQNHHNSHNNYQSPYTTLQHESDFNLI